jgi:tetratricopeptide (TPR) repeat protein
MCTSLSARSGRRWSTTPRRLTLFRAVGDRAGEATTLHNIGVVYDALGEKQKALEYYTQAQAIIQAVRRSGK